MVHDQSFSNNDLSDVKLPMVCLHQSQHLYIESSFQQPPQHSALAESWLCLVRPAWCRMCETGTRKKILSLYLSFFHYYYFQIRVLFCLLRQSNNTYSTLALSCVAVVSMSLSLDWSQTWVGLFLLFSSLFPSCLCVFCDSWVIQLWDKHKHAVFLRLIILNVYCMNAPLPQFNSHSLETFHSPGCNHSSKILVAFNLNMKSWTELFFWVVVLQLFA